MIQLHERAFLDPRDIEAADAELLGDLPLRPFLDSFFEPTDHDFALAFVEYVQVLVDLRLLDLGLHLVDHFVSFRAEDVDQGNLVAFLVRPDRIVQRHVLVRLLQRSEVHQDLVLDAARGEGGKLRSLIGLKSFRSP